MTIATGRAPIGAAAKTCKGCGKPVGLCSCGKGKGR
jgi:hypothetical protein